MKIFTSYFANYRKFDGLVPVNISLHPPKAYSGLSYTKIAPTESILRHYKETGDVHQYKVRYWYDVIKKLSPHECFKDIERLSGGKDCVLLCYEKAEDFCHRHLFATWMNKNGFEIDEL